MAYTFRSDQSRARSSEGVHDSLGPLCIVQQFLQYLHRLLRRVELISGAGGFDHVPVALVVVPRWLCTVCEHYQLVLSSPAHTHARRFFIPDDHILDAEPAFLHYVVEIEPHSPVGEAINHGTGELFQDRAHELLVPASAESIVRDRHFDFLPVCVVAFGSDTSGAASGFLKTSGAVRRIHEKDLRLGSVE